MNKKYKFRTNAIHAGQEPDPTTGAVMTPIFQTSTFAQEGIGKHKGYEYARTGNPTRTALENNLAALENGKAGFYFGSGLAATSTLFHALPANSHLIVTDNVYGGTYRLAKQVFEEKGLSFDFINTAKKEDIEKYIRPETKAIFVETPTNPMLKLTDLEMIANLAKTNDLISIVDNTFMSPYFQNPLDFGIDVVIHSTTKYINGHSDVVGGILVSNHSGMIEKFGYLQNAMGMIGGPMDAFLTLRATKTLAVRMEAHQENALFIAKNLEKHSKVKKVIYPGLESHSQHELAKKQTRGFGGIVTIELESKEQAEKFATSAKIFTLAESLGGVESLICHPAGMTHASVPLEERLSFGLTDAVLRLSVGIEDKEDLLNDINKALEHI
jgi:cystathionine beta-lyase/cystathionine gamma-synthase